MGLNCEPADGDQTVAYIEDMLIELRNMSQQARKPMLTYLIEMAIVEASDTGGTGNTIRSNQIDFPTNDIVGLTGQRPEK